jgi:hypothetical protein
MVVILKLCGNGLRKGYHAAHYGQLVPAFHRPCVVILLPQERTSFFGRFFIAPTCVIVESEKGGGS